tara:strand:- start:670 stop:1455 length:786 start_codon:yes stop_codon:yes gene_type:complete
VFDLPQANFEGFDRSKTELLKGDLNNSDDLKKAVKDTDCIIHLAAILPPTANTNIELAKIVNVNGTKKLIESVKKYNPNVHFVFSSSVSIYGKNLNNKVVDENTSPNPDDNYAITKYESEKIVTEAKIKFTVLRISGVSIPVFQEPPSEWPFLKNQLIEFVHRDDVVDAICNTVGNKDSVNKVFNISGGETWRTNGETYVKDYFDLVEVDINTANYQKEAGHFSWYDTDKSNNILKYQNKNYAIYLSEIKEDLERLLGSYE